MSNARCSTLLLVVLALATSWLTACATVGSERAGAAVCPPVVEYDRKFQTRTAEEVVHLPEDSALAAMMEDYAVMRDQARACKARSK